MTNNGFYSVHRDGKKEEHYKNGVSFKVYYLNEKTGIYEELPAGAVTNITVRAPKTKRWKKMRKKFKKWNATITGLIDPYAFLCDKGYKDFGDCPNRKPEK